MYYYSRTEDFIKDMLLSINIKHPDQLSITNISKALRIPVQYWEFKSESIRHSDRQIIFLNFYQTTEEQWQDFTHELAHVLWHAGRQEFLPPLFTELQEWQAEHFCYHCCIPTFMLEKLYNYTIYDVMQLFNVDYDFAYTRLEMHKSKMLTGGYFNEAYLTRA
ncbi:ImmA/IrrE family metallo-endopeptidase [Virgibacillus dokdonensis]|uniref:ImmA/IrrE family metallo-endopeptidase n=1 Tax=Virgibacillus dokdonensis TaxID=302167 RepID=A0ABU7VIQ8_9BACI